MTTPIWLLDVDGVLNALSKRGGKGYWPDWRSAEIDHPGDELTRSGKPVRLPLLWSKTVIATVRAAVNAGVDVRWLSTWRGDTRLLLDVIPGLPELPWLDEAILYSTSRSGGDSSGPCKVEVANACSPHSGGFDGLWKVEVAKAFVPGDAPLLWTEDEIAVDMLSESWRRARKAPTTFLRPHPNTGLIRKDVAVIREWITDFAPHPEAVTATDEVIVSLRKDGFARCTRDPDRCGAAGFSPYPAPGLVAQLERALA